MLYALYVIFAAIALALLEQFWLGVAFIGAMLWIWLVRRLLKY